MSSAPAKSDVPSNLEDGKLAQDLISRGLISREEWQQARTLETAGDAKMLLARLVQLGFLTLPQAQRLHQELPSITTQPLIKGYKLLDKLGQGSMGTVYKARQLSMNRDVAIKILHPKLAANKEFIDRFQREAHLAAKFSSTTWYRQSTWARRGACTTL